MEKALIIVWLLGMIAGITALFLAKKTLKGNKKKCPSIGKQ
ncbi:MAG: hypothetical protein ABGX24_00175 [Aquificota bacterium]|jgi:uncharacterized protein YneF (UPF0154 family)